MKRFLKQALTVLCGIFIVVYTVFQLSLTADDSVQTEHAFYSVVSEALTAEGYIFRDETVILQGSDGARSYSVDNGEKVALGQELCVIYEDTDQAEFQDRIRAINAQIEVLEKSSGGYFSDLGKTNDSISDYMQRVQESVSRGDLKSAARLQESLLIQMNRRQATVEGDADYFSSDIAELKREKAELEAGLSGEPVYTNADRAGYFYTETDGYENIFTASVLESLTTDGFKELINTASDVNLVANSVGKIAESSKWYIAFLCTRRDASDFDEDQKYTVSFPYSEADVEMTLERKTGKTGSEEVMLVFSSHSLLADFNFTRKQDVNVVKSVTEGLKVRSSALCNEDGVTGVYVLSAGTVVFKSAEVLMESGGFYLVALPDGSNASIRSATKLSLHDQVIISGKNLYVGKVLQ